MLAPASRAALLDRPGRGVEHLHKADRPAGLALGGHDDIVLRAQAAEGEPGAAAGLMDQRLVADRGEDLAQVVAHRQDEAGARVAATGRPAFISVGELGRNFSERIIV